MRNREPTESAKGLLLGLAKITTEMPREVKPGSSLVVFLLSSVEILVTNDLLTRIVTTFKKTVLVNN